MQMASRNETSVNVIYRKNNCYLYQHPQTQFLSWTMDIQRATINPVIPKRMEKETHKADRLVVERNERTDQIVILRVLPPVQNQEENWEQKNTRKRR